MVAEPNFCPHCGAVVTKGDDLFWRWPLKQRVYDYIRKHQECTTEQIMNHLYHSDPTGGPVSNIVSVTISQMRHILHAHGLEIVARRGPGSTYRLVSFKNRNTTNVTI